MVRYDYGSMFRLNVGETNCVKHKLQDRASSQKVDFEKFRYRKFFGLTSSEVFSLFLSFHLVLSHECNFGNCFEETLNLNSFW